ncbi:CheY-like chemotaxis protein [Actinoplanes octamycinicus]|uniref:CheY-like chemotaxis protein n=1 Tax=Actinoplanes octamycinicus TaxID=135948 RepID=A0A7W7H4X8_9ACTN|nr:response regulator [Actinoplanes octamycinicus]MBB4743993.1 CheY-like chemotaxis protein [Actinoplanes octamycinicus]GIE58617.1 hypothetical protein Aoc01nite_40190 [Actinoplanes octamycinicus]
MQTTSETDIDGLDALAFLHRMPPHENAPRPDLILLDLDLPRLDGRAVLAEAKTDPQTSAIPIIVFTASAAASDVTASYAAHANAYVTKPADPAGLDRVVQAICCFFGQTSVVPAPAHTLEGQRR